MTSYYALVRAEARDSVGGTLARHNACRIRPKSAVEAVGERENTFIVDDVRRGTAYARSTLARQRGRGAKGRPCVELFIGGPSAFDAPDAWTREKCAAYFAHVFEWIQERRGDDVFIAVAAIHRDEHSPHKHVMFVPAVKVKGKVRMSWDALQRERFVPKGREPSYERLQDDFWENVCKKYGLARGERGSTRKHKALDIVKRAEGMAEAEYNIERLRGQLEAHKERVDARKEIEQLRARAQEETEEMRVKAQQGVDELRTAYSLRKGFVSGEIGQRAREYMDRYEKLVRDHSMLSGVQDKAQKAIQKRDADLRQLRQGRKAEADQHAAATAELDKAVKDLHSTNNGLAKDVTRLNSDLVEVRKEEGERFQNLKSSIAFLFLSLRDQLVAEGKSDAWSLIFNSNSSVQMIVSDGEAMLREKSSGTARGPSHGVGG